MPYLQIGRSLLRPSGLLTNRQVCQDFFTPSSNNNDPQITANLFDSGARTPTLAARASEYLLCLTVGQFKETPAVNFGQRNSGGKIVNVPLIDLDMVRQLLNPRPVCLDIACDSCQLGPDDLVRYQRLAKGMSILGIFVGVFQARSSLRIGINRDDQAFSVEVYGQTPSVDSR